MLKEIQFAGNVRTPFSSFCGTFADVSAVELGKVPLERSGVQPENVKELLAGNILSGALRPNAARQMLIEAAASSAAEWEAQWALN